MRIKRIYEGFKSNLIIIIALSSFVYMVFVGFGGGSSDESKVWVLAKHEVEQSLKSPNSAKFPSKDKATILETDDGYQITSYVDANNSFGASIRSNFIVTLTKKSNGDYKLESVYID